MSLKKNSSENAAPLLQDEIDSAQAELKNGAHDKASKIPIIPVPADAPPCDFAMPAFGGKPTRLYPYHQADGALAGYIGRWDIINPETGAREKKILPVCYCDVQNNKKAWRSAGIPSPRPPYRLPEILAQTNATIVICEGEKTADAAQFLLPSCVATTPMHGAQSPKKTDWLFVKGRKVIVATDFDEAGKQFGDAVYDLCVEAGAASIFHLPAEIVGKRRPTETDFDTRSEAVPQGYDLADALEQAWTAESMERFISRFSPPPYIKNSELSEYNNSVGEAFRLTKNGVEHAIELKDENKNTVLDWSWFCSYLMITHLTRDGDGQNWGRICFIIDSDGKQKEYVLPMSMMAGDGVAYREALLSNGVILAPNAHKLLHSYITTARPKARATCVLKTGWHGGCYVLSDRVYGQKSGERIVLQSYQSTKNLAMRGTLAEWQDSIGKLCVNNSRLEAAICIALAGPLLALVGEESFGLHFVGGSSIGKTTLLRVAASVWGAAIESWRTTDNAAEGLARQANDGFLALDELSQVDGSSADAMIYMLGNGSGKRRSRSDGTAKPIERFRLAFLSSGETGLAAKLHEIGKAPKAGQAVRFVEIHADAGHGYGVFDDLHTNEDGNRFSVELKHFAEQFTGTVAHAFLTMLCADCGQAAAKVADVRKRWGMAHIPADSDGQVMRVGQKFALIAATGELAIVAKILPWPVGEAERACARLFADWLISRGGTQAFEARDAERRLREFIAEHGSSRFEAAWQEDKNNMLDRKTIQRAGFKQMIKGAWEYYILAEAFDKEIVGGLNKSVVKKHLLQSGLIQPDKAGKSMVSVRVPGHGQMRLYHVPASILEERGLPAEQ